MNMTIPRTLPRPNQSKRIEKKTITELTPAQLLAALRRAKEDTPPVATISPRKLLDNLRRVIEESRAITVAASQQALIQKARQKEMLIDATSDRKPRAL